jgi:hypothetical protein
VSGRSMVAACLAAAGLAAGAGMAIAVAAPAAVHREAANVTLRHAPTGFSVAAPSGYRLRVSPGVYRITGGQVGVTVRIVRSAKGARAFGEALKRSADTVVARSGGRARFLMLSDAGGVRTSRLVVRRGSVLVVTIGTHPRGRAALARIVSRIGASVRGGTPKPASGTPGTPAPSGRLIPLTPFRAPDGGATAWVPSDPDWSINSVGGALEGSGPRGSFLLGRSFNILYPGVLPPGQLPQGSVEHPFVSAIDALEKVWPLINQGQGINMTNVKMRALIGDATLPTFRSSGMMVYDYTINGVPFTGVANVATEDRLSANGTFFWQMYISTIQVPDNGDPTVGAALRLVWRSWNPSGAIAQRNEQARQILNEINQTWRSVAEFRSRTADQQSRDVSCLLRTGPFIDDNARALGLPPLLDCDSTYVPRT